MLSSGLCADKVRGIWVESAATRQCRQEILARSCSRFSHSDMFSISSGVKKQNSKLNVLAILRETAPPSNIGEAGVCGTESGNQAFSVDRADANNSSRRKYETTERGNIDIWKRQEVEGKDGKVYLVGTGPGDTGMLTLRAAQLLQSADVVFYDRLVSDSTLSLIPDDTAMVYVGKAAGKHSHSQHEINDLLATYASAGKIVVRLKGGDPFLFGRGGEEMQILEAQGVDVEVVPGITAASGIGADLGIPLSHRDYASRVLFLTGHAKDDGPHPLEGIEGQFAADRQTTIVIYMGLSTLPTTIARLIELGLDPETPAIAVENGTTPKQRQVCSEMHRLKYCVEAAHFKSPTLVIIGDVIKLSPIWKHRDSGSLQYVNKNRPQEPEETDDMRRTSQLLSEMDLERWSWPIGTRAGKLVKWLTKKRG